MQQFIPLIKQHRWSDAYLVMQIRKSGSVLILRCKISYKWYGVFYSFRQDSSSTNPLLCAPSSFGPHSIAGRKSLLWNFQKTKKQKFKGFAPPFWCQNNEAVLARKLKWLGKYCELSWSWHRTQTAHCKNAERLGNPRFFRFGPFKPVGATATLPRPDDVIGAANE